MPYGKRSLISGNLLSHLQHLLLHLLWHRFHPSLLLPNIFITQTTVLPATQWNTLLQQHHPLQRLHTTMIMEFNVHFRLREETIAR